MNKDKIINNDYDYIEIEDMFTLISDFQSINTIKGFFLHISELNNTNYMQYVKHHVGNQLTTINYVL